MTKPVININDYESEADTCRKYGILTAIELNARSLYFV